MSPKPPGRMLSQLSINDTGSSENRGESSTTSTRSALSSSGSGEDPDTGYRDRSVDPLPFSGGAGSQHPSYVLADEECPTGPSSPEPPKIKSLPSAALTQPSLGHHSNVKLPPGLHINPFNSWNRGPLPPAPPDPPTINLIPFGLACDERDVLRAKQPRMMIEPHTDQLVHQPIGFLPSYYDWYALGTPADPLEAGWLEFPYKRPRIPKNMKGISRKMPAHFWRERNKVSGRLEWCWDHPGKRSNTHIERDNWANAFNSMRSIQKAQRRHDFLNRPSGRRSGAIEAMDKGTVPIKKMARAFLKWGALLTPAWKSSREATKNPTSKSTKCRWLPSDTTREKFFALTMRPKRGWYRGASLDLFPRSPSLRDYSSASNSQWVFFSKDGVCKWRRVNKLPKPIGQRRVGAYWAPPPGALTLPSLNKLSLEDTHNHVDNAHDSQEGRIVKPIAEKQDPLKAFEASMQERQDAINRAFLAASAGGPDDVDQQTGEEDSPWSQEGKDSADPGRSFVVHRDECPSGSLSSSDDRGGMDLLAKGYESASSYDNDFPNFQRFERQIYPIHRRFSVDRPNLRKHLGSLSYWNAIQK